MAGLSNLKLIALLSAEFSYGHFLIFARSCEYDLIYGDILLTLYSKEGMLILEGYNSESGK